MLKLYLTSVGALANTTTGIISQWYVSHIKYTYTFKLKYANCSCFPHSVVWKVVPDVLGSDFLVQGYT